jgi:hypothetical protein
MVRRGRAGPLGFKMPTNSFLGEGTLAASAGGLAFQDRPPVGGTAPVRDPGAMQALPGPRFVFRNFGTRPSASLIEDERLWTTRTLLRSIAQSRRSPGVSPTAAVDPLPSFDTAHEIEAPATPGFPNYATAQLRALYTGC